MTPDDYPSTRVLRGEESGQVTMRIVKHSTGEQRWRIVKSRAVHDSRGRPRLVVSVIEDITERKRSELAQRLLSRTGEVLASSSTTSRRCARSPGSLSPSSPTGAA